MNDADFYQRFSLEVGRVQQRLGLRNISSALAAWIGVNYFEIDDEDEIRTSVCDGSNDQGIDAIFFDESQRRLEIVQAKFPLEKNIRNAFPENQIKTTLAGVKLITVGPFVGSVSPKLEDLARRYHELLNSGGFTVRLTFFSLLGPPADTTHVDLFHQEHSSIFVEFQGTDELKAFFADDYLIRRAEPPEKLVLPLIGSVLEKPLPKPSAVFTTNATDLAVGVVTHGARLFQDNVRLFLGSRKRSRNFRIRETAESATESSLFWYYNNGINIVCKEIEIPANRKVVILHRPQIVNGAQTSYSLAQAYQDGRLQPETYLLVKAVQESDRNFVKNVTLYTNSQNPVSLRDFAANDSIQLEIAKICKALGHYYEKKRGELDEESPSKGEKEKALGSNWQDRIINNEQVAQYYMAWELGWPAEAKREKRRIFDQESDGLYFKIFNVTTVPEELVFLHLLGAFVRRKTVEFRARFATVDAEEDEKVKDGILRDEFLNHADQFIVALMKPYLARGLGVSGFERATYAQLIRELMVSTEMLNAPYASIVEDLRPLFAQKRKAPTYSHTKYFKNEQAYGEIKRYLRHDLARDFIEE